MRYIWCFIVLISCDSSKTQLNFIGKWQVIEIVENQESDFLEDNWIHLFEDGTFKSFDGITKIHEAGNWTYDSEENKLSIIDEEKHKGTSEWYMSTKYDTLIFSSLLAREDLYLKAIKVNN